MNLLFYFTSERVYRDTEGNCYASGNFPPEVWERYLKICNKLYVIMREGKEIYDIKIQQCKKEKITNPNMEMILVQDIYDNIQSYMDIKKRNKNYRLIQSAVKKCDFLIIRSTDSIVIRLAEKHHKPYMIECVGCTWDAMWNHGWKGKLLAIPSFFNARRQIRKAEWVLYVTNQFLQKRYPTNGRNLGVSDVSITETNDSILWKRLDKIKNQEGPVVLGTAAAVNVPYKGQEYVIRAIGQLKEEGCIVRYEMAGLGSSERLVKIARECNVLDQVKFTGELSHDDVFNWMDSIDVYIQPSLLEGLPRALVEAMSRGLPALGSAVGGIPELLDASFTFSPGDVGEIVRLLKKIDKDEMACLAEKNFNSGKKFCKDVLNQKRDEFYKTFMERTLDNKQMLG